jgi:hypothetical protein
MSEVKGKALDTKLAGIRRDEKFDLALRGVKGLGDMCDRLSRRMDAFEGSKKKPTDARR